MTLNLKSLIKAQQGAVLVLSAVLLPAVILAAGFTVDLSDKTALNMSGMIRYNEGEGDDLVNYFGKNVLVPVRQGAKTLSLPLQNLKVDFQNKNIVYDDNQLLKWCLCNLMVTQDSNGNYNTTKNRNDKSL